MKIVEVVPYIVKIRRNAGGGVYWYFVKLTTDNNSVGWGEVCWNSFDPATYKRLVMNMAEAYLIGESPFNVERIFLGAFHRHGHSHADLSMMGIVSGFEMACWDIIGKETNHPVYDLLGGKVNERIRTYTYLIAENDDIWCEDFWQMEEACIKRAREYAEMGFTAIKFDPFSPYISALALFQPDLKMMSRAERTVRGIREAVGDSCDIIIGTHGQFSAAGAIRVARMLEKYNPLWIEEPTPPENPLVMEKVSRATSIPIASGERLATKWEFAPMIQSGCVDIVQLDIAGLGGILEAKKIAAMADAAHMQITPHFYAGPINYAAALQIDVCCSNFLIQETIERMDSHGLNLLVKKPFVWEDGYVIPSGEPGLGVEMDEEMVRKYSVDAYEEANVLLGKDAAK